MLHQELPPIESTPLDGWEPWLVPAIAVAAGLTAAVILVAVGQTLLGAFALVGGIAAAVVLSRAPATQPLEQPLAASPDYSLVGAALGLSDDPVALTDGEGTLLVVNPAYRERFTSTPPLRLAVNEDAGQALALARSMAWRDGA